MSVFNAAKNAAVELGSGRIELSRTDSVSYIDFKTGTVEDFDCRIQQFGNGLRFYTGGQGNTEERLRIASDGNVGIGTDNPTSPLQVVSSANNIVQIRSTTRYSTMYMIDSIGSSFIQNDSGHLRFGTGGGANASGGEDEALRITSDGEIRIANGGLLTIKTDAAATYGVSEAFRIDDSNATNCLLYTSPSPRDLSTSRMPSSA